MDSMQSTDADQNVKVPEVQEGRHCVDVKIEGKTLSMELT